MEILFAKKSDLDTHEADTSNPHVVTASQVSLGALDSPTFVGLTLSADLVTTSTIDGRDVAADGVTADAALPKAGGQMTGNITMAAAETVDGRDLSADGTKLDGVETGATADQTNAEIKTAYEANVDTNEFSDAEQTKLAGIETSATADQTGAEIKTAYEAEANAYTDTKDTKLAGIATGAEVNPPPISQADAEAGTATVEETFTAERVKQAIAALETGIAGSGITTIELVRKTADETVNNSTTLQDDDTLLAALASNEVVAFQCTIFHIGNGTADFKLAFTVPSGAAIRWGMANAQVAPGGTLQGANVTNSSGSSQAVQGETGERAQLVTGLVKNGGTSGNLQLQWAQNTATVVDTKVITDSHLIVWRI